MARFDYPANFYALKRVVAREISDYLVLSQKQLDRGETPEFVGDFVSRISLASGLSTKTINQLLAQRGVLIPKEVLV